MIVVTEMCAETVCVDCGSVLSAGPHHPPIQIAKPDLSTVFVSSGSYLSKIIGYVLCLNVWCRPSKVLQCQ